MRKVKDDFPLSSLERFNIVQLVVFCFRTHNFCSHRSHQHCSQPQLKNPFECHPLLEQLCFKEQVVKKRSLILQGSKQLSEKKSSRFDFFLKSQSIIDVFSSCHEQPSCDFMLHMVRAVHSKRSLLAC